MRTRIPAFTSLSLTPMGCILVCGAVVLTALADPVQTDARTPSPGALASAVTLPTGKTIVVNMIQKGAGMRFEPSDITVEHGDAIKFVNVSGGPHNVAFDPAKIPAPAKGPLSTGMPGQLSPLTGPFIATPNGTYTMTVATVPAGKYPYFCTPHVSMGMTGTITVK
jgi:plastocyanin